MRRYPVRTELFSRDDDLDARVLAHVDAFFAGLPAAGPDHDAATRGPWWFFLSEKVVAITQGRSYFVWDIKVGRPARVLSRYVTRTPAGIGLGSPFTMQLAIQEAGLPRVLYAAAGGAVGKVIGRKGLFYELVGNDISAIDGPTEYSAYPSNVSAKLAPKDPDAVAARLVGRDPRAGARAVALDLRRHGGHGRQRHRPQRPRLRRARRLGAVRGDVRRQPARPGQRADPDGDGLPARGLTADRAAAAVDGGARQLAVLARAGSSPSAGGSTFGLAVHSSQPSAPSGTSMRWVKIEKSTTPAVAPAGSAPQPTSTAEVAVSVTPTPPGRDADRGEQAPDGERGEEQVERQGHAGLAHDEHEQHVVGAEEPDHAQRHRPPAAADDVVDPRPQVVDELADAHRRRWRLSPAATAQASGPAGRAVEPRRGRWPARPARWP